jgi:deoxyribonuclease (pyrimidine dimer)
MVRVNLVPVTELSNQHLLAERVELLMLSRNLQKFKLTTIPDKYCLGTGHQKFFMNKTRFLLTRFILIEEECVQRKFNITSKYEEIRHNLINYNSKNANVIEQTYWIPTEDEIKISRDRIQSRIKEKPTYYKWS